MMRATMQCNSPPNAATPWGPGKSLIKTFLLRKSITIGAGIVARP
jgi:hypothetical protein